VKKPKVAGIGGSCDDGNKCTETDKCDGYGKCVGDENDCSSAAAADVCTVGVCNVSTGDCEAKDKK
jgi:hypothetical protein